MARIRSIKPEFFTSATIDGLADDATRLTFIGLWTYADDAGRGVDDRWLIKAAIWPRTDSKTPDQIELFMVRIHAARLITRYEVEGRRYFQIVSWEEHQTINRPSSSRLPADPSLSAHGVCSEDSSLACSSACLRNREQGTGNREQGTGIRARHGGLSEDPREDFLKFWETYPTPQSGTKPDRGKCSALWDKLTAPQREAATIGVAHYRAVCDAGRYAKDPLRWLRDKCWTDYQEPPSRALTSANGSSARSQNQLNAEAAALAMGLDPANSDPFGAAP